MRRRELLTAAGVLAKVFGTDHPDTAATRRNLQMLHQSTAPPADGPQAGQSGGAVVDEATEQLSGWFAYFFDPHCNPAPVKCLSSQSARSSLLHPCHCAGRRLIPVFIEESRCRFF